MFRNCITTFFVLLIAGMASAGNGPYPVVPAGTEIAVRLQEDIDSNRASPGDLFDARIEREVEVNGEVVIPDGSPAKVVLVENIVEGPGGTPLYALELKEVTVRGRTYPLTTGFGETRGEIQRVPPDEAEDVPQGTTEVDEVIDAAARGEGAALATVRGAGVSFHLIRGPEVNVASDVAMHFILAEVLQLRPDEAVPK